MSAPTTTEFAAFVGIDWADRKHDVCLLPAGASTPEFSVLPHLSTVTQISPPVVI